MKIKIEIEIPPEEIIQIQETFIKNNHEQFNNATMKAFSTVQELWLKSGESFFQNFKK